MVTADIARCRISARRSTDRRAAVPRRSEEVELAWL